MKPFHNGEDKNDGGPHGTSAAIADIDGGKMDGFVEQAQEARLQGNGGCRNANGSARMRGRRDGLSRRPGDPELLDLREDFALQDDMFASSASWSLPEHL